MEWWKERVAYQIYPMSFCDSNGDGYGDIPGIIAHLDDIKALGAGIIWLSPVYPSPWADNGYDISNYKDIHPKLGTLEDMDRLIAEANARDIKIVMDLVVNHTSDQHRWFIESKKPNSPYRDYYIWRPGKGATKENPRGIAPPNNWTSFFASDCWTFDEERGEYYLHLFATEQPDLNWRNPKVLEEVEDVLRFWLDRGVSGFRCDVINCLYKDSLEDGKKQLALVGVEHYLSREGTHNILKRLREDVLDHYDCFTVGETAMVSVKEAHDFIDPERKELNMLFEFEHLEADEFKIKWLHTRFKPQKFMECFARWQKEFPWNALYLENHDQPRSVSRYGDDRKWHDESAKMLATLLLTLKGTPFLYQGQEIGMTNFDYTSMEQLNDVESHNVEKLMKKMHFPKWYRWRAMRHVSRDNARTPMQWNTDVNAGFSTGTPWLAVNGNYQTINYEAQKDDPNSVLSYYKKLIKLRSESGTLLNGDFKLMEATRTFCAYCRTWKDECILVLLNFSPNTRFVGYGGATILSTYPQRKEYDGCLWPYEGVIVKGKKLKEKVK